MYISTANTRKLLISEGICTHSNTKYSFFFPCLSCTVSLFSPIPFSLSGAHTVLYFFPVFLVPVCLGPLNIYWHLHHISLSSLLLSLTTLFIYLSVTLFHSYSSFTHFQTSVPICFSSIQLFSYYYSAFHL